MKLTRNTNERNHLRLSHLAAVFLVFFFALLGIYLLGHDNAFAQSQFYEPENVITANPHSDPNDDADNINNKMDKLHGNISKFLDTAIASDQIFDSNEIEHIKKEKARSKKAKDRFHKNGGLKQVGRKNDFGKDNRKKDDYDPNAFNEFEEALDNLNDIILDANDALADGQKSKAMYLLLAASGSPDKCQELVDASDGLGIAAAAVLGAKIAAETLYNTTDAIGNQDALGWNVSAASAIFAVATGVLDMTATGLEIADNWVAQDLESACLNQIDDAVKGIQTVTEGTSQDVNDQPKLLKTLPGHYRSSTRQ